MKGDPVWPNTPFPTAGAERHLHRPLFFGVCERRRPHCAQVQPEQHEVIGARDGHRDRPLTQNCDPSSLSSSPRVRTASTCASRIVASSADQLWDPWTPASLWKWKIIRRYAFSRRSVSSRVLCQPESPCGDVKGSGFGGLHEAAKPSVPCLRRCCTLEAWGPATASCHTASSPRRPFQSVTDHLTAKLLRPASPREGGCARALEPLISPGAT